MAIGALSIRGLSFAFLCKLPVAAFAVFMVSNVQLPDLAVSLGRIVTAGALFNRLALLPDVLTILILVMAAVTGFNVAVCMF